MPRCQFSRVRGVCVLNWTHTKTSWVLFKHPQWAPTRPWVVGRKTSLGSLNNELETWEFGLPRFTFLFPLSTPVKNVTNSIDYPGEVVKGHKWGVLHSCCLYNVSVSPGIYGALKARYSIFRKEKKKESCWLITLSILPGVKPIQRDNATSRTWRKKSFFRFYYYYFFGVN